MTKEEIDAIVEFANNELDIAALQAENILYADKEDPDDPVECEEEDKLLLHVKECNHIIIDVLQRLFMAYGNSLEHHDLIYITSILSDLMLAKPISAVEGHEYEWYDIDVKNYPQYEDLKTFQRSFRGFDYSIDIESIQANKRYRGLYRFNNDNDLAHIANLIAFTEEDGSVKTTIDSIRFVELPVTYTSPVVIPAEIENPVKYIEDVSEYLPGLPFPVSYVNVIRDGKQE